MRIQVTVLTLELDSPTLPGAFIIRSPFCIDIDNCCLAGKKIAFNLSDTAKLADTKKNPIIIKEGVEYKSVHCGL